MKEAKEIKETAEKKKLEKKKSLEVTCKKTWMEPKDEKSLVGKHILTHKVAEELENKSVPNNVSAKMPDIITGSKTHNYTKKTHEDH